MKKHYVFAGLIIAVLAAGTVDVIGGRSPGRTALSPAPAESDLPTTHPPATEGTAGTQAGMADDSANLKKRIAKLETVHAKSPKNTKAMLELAEAYFLAARFDKATALYTEALAAKPHSDDATVGLAMVWHAQGEDGKAIAALTRVLKSDRQNQQAYYTMAIISFSQQDIDAARKEWAIAARIDPKSQIGKASQDFVDLIDNKNSAPHSE